jgi:phosphopantothenoylcysteine synthetase/decarboxylase
MNFNKKNILVCISGSVASIKLHIILKLL